METPTTIRRWIDLIQWSRGSFLLAILMLGAGVFLWGTAYKMSLYESSPIHNKVPVAKLSTQAGATNKEQATSAATPRNAVAYPLLLVLALFFFALNLLACASPAETLHKPHSFYLSYLPSAGFLRPPPFPLHG